MKRLFKFLSANNQRGRRSDFGILFHFIPDVQIFIDENEKLAHALWDIEAWDHSE